MFIRIDDNKIVSTVFMSNEDNLEGLIEVTSVPAIKEIEGKVCKQKYDSGVVINIYEDIITPTNSKPQPTNEEINAKLDMVLGGMNDLYMTFIDPNYVPE